MAKFRIELSNQAGKILEKMIAKEPQMYKRVARVLDNLEEDPFLGKALKGQLKGRYSYRIGSFRIIYKVQRNILIIYVIDIGHKRDIYK